MGRNGTANNGLGIINGINETISDENVLGFQIYWTLYNKRVNTEEFKTDMLANGFDPLMLRNQTDKRRFTEVVEEVCSKYETESKLSHNRIPYKYEAKKVFDCGGKLAMKIVRGVAHVEGSSDEALYDSEIEYHQDTTVIFNSNQGQSKIEGKGLNFIIQDIKDSFKSYRDKTSTEFIRFTFTDLLRKAGSVSMRGSGGIYFLPVVKSSVIEGIKNLTVGNSLGTIYQLRLPAGSAEKQGIKDSVQNELSQRLKYYVERVENVNRTSTFEDSKKENGEEKKGIKTQVKEDVADLFSLYSELLAESVNVDERQAEKDNMFSEIREQYAELEISITERMVEIEKCA